MLIPKLEYWRNWFAKRKFERQIEDDQYETMEMCAHADELIKKIDEAVLRRSMSPHHLIPTSMEEYIMGLEGRDVELQAMIEEELYGDKNEIEIYKD